MHGLGGATEGELHMRCTLMPGRWYAMEMIGDAFGTGLRHDSPIQVEAIRPTRTGQRVFALQLYHANYPAGVRTTRYTLHTLARGERFLLAKSMHHTPPRFLMIYDITGEWLREHVGVGPSAEWDVDAWLNRHA
jgi:hypothetical protein